VALLLDSDVLIDGVLLQMVVVFAVAGDSLTNSLLVISNGEGDRIFLELIVDTDVVVADVLVPLVAVTSAVEGAVAQLTDTI